MERRALRAVEVGAVARLAVLAGFAVTSSSPDPLRTGGGDVARYAVYATGIGVQDLPSWFPWEYPALARTLMGLLPAATPERYVVSFALAALAIDLGVLVWLGRRTVGDAPATGVWLWAVAVPLLGMLACTRYDLFVTALVMVALVLAVERPVLAAAVLSLAVGLKWWPLVVLPLVVASAPPRRRLLTAAAGLAPWLLVETLGIWAWGRASLTEPLRWLASRGAEVEAPVALPQLWSFWRGGTAPAWQHNAVEFVEVGWFPLAVSVVGAATVVVVLTRTSQRLVAVRENRLLVLSLAASVVVGAVVVTGHVLSPQYLLWLLGPLAVLGTVAGSPLRRSWVVVGCLVAGLTTAVFPLAFDALVEGHVVPLLLVTARNLLLIGLVASLLRAWWQECGGRGQRVGAAAAVHRAERVNGGELPPSSSDTGHHGRPGVSRRGR